MSGTQQGDRQWLRKWRVIAADNSGSGIDLSQLRVRFEVQHSNIQSPNTAAIRLYNISRPTMAPFLAKEFTRVRLEAGYQSNMGLIFDGEIKQSRKGRESAVDSFLDIFAAESIQAYTYMMVNKTLASGYTQDDALNAALQNGGKYNVSRGEVLGDMGTFQNPRGKACFGLGRDYLRDIARTNDMTWSIDNGQVNLMKNTGYRNTEAVIINSMTGMIGWPEQTIEGIYVRTLLNPKIRAGNRVKIDQNSVVKAKLSLADASPEAIKQNEAGYSDVTDDGDYFVWTIDHIGDSRGNPWFTDLVCQPTHGHIGLGTSISR